MSIERFAALQWMALAVVLFWLVHLLGPVLTPFVAAGILAYMCNPLVNRLCAWHWPRTLATAAVLLAIFMLFALLLLIMVWIAFGAGQLLEGMAVTPWLVGERIGLHPLAVTFSLLACGRLFGFFGVLLALPMSAVLLVFLHHGKSWYLSSSLHQG